MDKLANKMETALMDIVGNRDATRGEIGKGMKRNFKASELKQVCEDNYTVGNLIRIMMKRRPNIFRWRQTKLDEYMNGEEIVGFTDYYHEQKLTEFIKNLLDKDRMRSLENVVGIVKREYVRNYDTWKYFINKCKNISMIYNQKMDELNEYETENEESQETEQKESYQVEEDEFDALYDELERNARMNKIAVDMFKEWLINNEYDEEAIINDIIVQPESSNILRYFIERYGNGERYFQIIRNWSLYCCLEHLCCACDCKY